MNTPITPQPCECDGVRCLRTRDELWRYIPGSDGYEASSAGRVRSSRSGKLRVLTPGCTTVGYPQVTIRAGKIFVPRPVHRLVLEAFVGPRPHGLVACHGNGVRTDNRVCNLRWDTYSANQQDAYRHGTARRGEEHYTALLSESRAKSIIALTGLVPPWELACWHKVNIATVRHVQWGKTWTHLQRQSPPIRVSRKHWSSAGLTTPTKFPLINDLVGRFARFLCDDLGATSGMVGSWIGISEDAVQRAVIRARRKLAVAL